MRFATLSSLCFAGLLGSACVEIADLRVAGEDIDVVFAGSGSIAPCGTDTRAVTWVSVVEPDDPNQQWTIQVPRPIGQASWPLNPQQGVVGERARLHGPGLPLAGIYAQDGQLDLGPPQRELLVTGEFANSEGDLFEVRVYTRRSDHGSFELCP